MRVLCASCGSESGAGRCEACGEPTRLAARYTLLEMVGQGAMGVTYRATDEASGDTVAIKEMPLRHTVDHKARERMRREAAVLRQLRHDRIPSYVDHFEQGEGKHRAFYLVQAFIDGGSLADELAGRRYTESDVVAILVELLDVLEYLHELQPPVVHRDLKPRNVLRRRSDGHLVLIDFGAVQDVLKDPALGGSTVAGTYGYMAPEQFRGDASPQSDLYALGVLAIVLLSRKDPVDLVRPDHTLGWQEHVHASDGLKALLARMVSPEPGERPADAEAVRAELRSPRRTTGTGIVAAGPIQLPAELPRRKDRAMAALLGYVTSFVGGHNLYLQRPWRFALSVLFCWTMLPTLVSILDAIAFARMSDARFDVQFNRGWVEMERRRVDAVTQEIERLHQLHLRGALSKEEFAREKKRLLSEQRGGMWEVFDRDRIESFFSEARTLANGARSVFEEIADEFQKEARRHRRRHGRKKGKWKQLP